MKSLKVLIGMGVLILAAMSSNAFSDTLLSCSWTSISSTSIYNGVKVTQACHDDSTVAATRQRTWGQYYSGECSNLQAKSGYRVSGSCLSPNVYKVESTGSSSSSSSSGGSGGHCGNFYATTSASQIAATISTAYAPGGYCSGCSSATVRPGSSNNSYMIFCGA